MAKTKPSDKLKKDFGTLQDDLGRLADDVSKTWGNILEFGKAEAGARKDEIADELKSKFENLKSEIENMKEKGAKIFSDPSQAIKNTGKKIEENPLLSVCIAFGAGIFLGKIIEKITKNND